MTEHHLKTWPPQFQAILDRTKTFEFRRNDRHYAVGDILYLEEYEPQISHEVLDARQVVIDRLGFYTGRKTIVKVTYVMDKGFGLPDGFCILGLDFLRPVPAYGPIESRSFNEPAQIPTHTFP